ncbi:MAG: DUF4410 domain-containing protein [Gammaproteobacteria bacterium]
MAPTRNSQSFCTAVYACVSVRPYAGRWNPNRLDGAMMTPNNRLYLMGLTAIMVLAAGCQSNRHAGSSGVLGEIDIRNEQLTGSWPAELPKTVYVADFSLEAQRVETDQEGQGMFRRERLAGIGQRLPHPLAEEDPEMQAGAIVDAMSRSLVKTLGDKGFIAQSLPGTQTALPQEGWLLQGVFTEVDEGNRIKRAVIGFGRGATSMEVQVAVSNLASDHPKTPFIVFGTVKSPKKMPEAAVTVNPHVAEAKFVMEKNATEMDIRMTAKKIVDVILEHSQKFKEQAKPREAAHSP